MDPLLLRACKSGSYGDLRIDDSGYIAVAGLCYCFGKPSKKLWGFLQENYKNRIVVPMSEQWREELEQHDPEYAQARRWAMRPTPLLSDTGHLMRLEEQLPPGYLLSSMGAADVSRNPFGHGRQYRTPEAFEREGVGCAVRIGEEIVSAASSFITFRGEIEVDVATLPAHRRKGLARACAAGLMRRCALKGLVPHWDAQNPASRALAEELGYETEREYTVFVRSEYLRFL
ncbi:MAG: GNAT family N-acetyltransferase [Eubacteriales bacterium]|nr:GNAT family N-acetyltransferase [Eubacteriales bacterium]